MNTDLSQDLLQHLASLPISKRKMGTCNRQTRMWQDLGIYGEIADDFLTDLAETYQIDLSKFNQVRYYPDEFEGKGLATRILMAFVPFLEEYVRNRRFFASLTLGMIDDAIVSKRLI